MRRLRFRFPGIPRIHLAARPRQRGDLHALPLPRLQEILPRLCRGHFYARERRAGLPMDARAVRQDEGRVIGATDRGVPIPGRQDMRLLGPRAFFQGDLNYTHLIPACSSFLTTHQAIRAPLSLFHAVARYTIVSFLDIRLILPGGSWTRSNHD